MKSLLDKINAKLNAQGGFLKAVSVLVGGTAFAQVIGFICLPILTRLYTPEDYSVLGVYIAIVSILSVISCLRFDIAIPIPDKEPEGKALLLLSLVSNTIFFLILYLILIISYPFIQDFKIIKQLSYWIWLIPFGVYISGLYSALQYWATRHKRFKDIAHTRMTQSVLGNGTSVATGFMWGGFGGLIVGQLLNFSGGLVKLATSASKDLSLIKSSPLKSTLLKYSDYPKYSTFEALANTSAIQLPLILIASFIIGPEVGFLMLAMKVLGIPVALIGGAMGQVYLSQAPVFYKNKQLYTYTILIIKKIAKLIMLPFIIILILAPYIFDIVFGKDWAGLSDYVLLMLPWYFMQILASPVSMSLHIIGYQKAALLLQVLGFLLRVVGLFFILVFSDQIFLYYYVFSGFLFYFIYIFIILFCIKRNEIKFRV